MCLIIELMIWPVWNVGFTFCKNVPSVDFTYSEIHLICLNTRNNFDGLDNQMNTSEDIMFNSKCKIHYFFNAICNFYTWYYIRNQRISGMKSAVCVKYLYPLHLNFPPKPSFWIYKTYIWNCDFPWCFKGYLKLLRSVLITKSI